MLAPTNPRTIDLLGFALFMEKLPPEKYNQNFWGDYDCCNTPACIFGWYSRTHDISDAEVNGAMGITVAQAVELFRGSGARNIDGSPTTPKQAALVIRHLALTGEVDWTKAGGSDA